MTVKSVNFISNNITKLGPINVTSLPHSSISLGHSLLVLNFNQLVPKGMHITQKHRILFWEKERERRIIMPQFLLYYWWSIHNSLYNQIIMWTVFPIPPICVLRVSKRTPLSWKQITNYTPFWFHTKRVGWRGQTVGWTSLPRLSTTARLQPNRKISTD